MQTVLDGCNFYQNKLIHAVNPYPTADAALIVLSLRAFADAILKENPFCVALLEDLQGRVEAPEFQSTAVQKKTKKRK